LGEGLLAIEDVVAIAWIDLGIDGSIGRRIDLGVGGGVWCVAHLQGVRRPEPRPGEPTREVRADSGVSGIAVGEGRRRLGRSGVAVVVELDGRVGPSEWIWITNRAIPEGDWAKPIPETCCDPEWAASRTGLPSTRPVGLAEPMHSTARSSGDEAGHLEESEPDRSSDRGGGDGGGSVRPRSLPTA
jgi:hypothetical protein